MRWRAHLRRPRTGSCCRPRGSSPPQPTLRRGTGAVQGGGRVQGPAGRAPTAAAAAAAQHQRHPACHVLPLHLEDVGTSAAAAGAGSSSSGIAQRRQQWRRRRRLTSPVDAHHRRPIHHARAERHQLPPLLLAGNCPGLPLCQRLGPAQKRVDQTRGEELLGGGGSTAEQQAAGAATPCSAAHHPHDVTQHSMAQHGAAPPRLRMQNGSHGIRVACLDGDQVPICLRVGVARVSIPEHCCFRRGHDDCRGAGSRCSVARQGHPCCWLPHAAVAGRHHASQRQRTLGNVHALRARVQAPPSAHAPFSTLPALFTLRSTLCTPRMAGPMSLA